MTAQKKVCPECGVMVKEANLDSHLQRVHGTSLEELEGRGGIDPMHKIVSAVLVVMIIAVAAFGYYWVVLREGDGGSGAPADGALPNGDSDLPATGVPHAVINIQGQAQSIVIRLEPGRAPVTVANFIRYADEGFYNGLIFHRVMEGFMIQGGGFEPDLSLKPTHDPIVNEASTSRMRNLRGTIAMARTGDPDTATSQFFINHVDNSFLDWDNAADGYGYCVFGSVVEGMALVDIIEGVPTETRNGMDDVPVQDVIISSVVIEYR